VHHNGRVPFDRINSNRMKMHYDILANSNGFQEGDLVWLYKPKLIMKEIA
jgi:hypothetical protein